MKKGTTDATAIAGSKTITLGVTMPGRVFFRTELSLAEAGELWTQLSQALEDLRRNQAGA